MLNRVRIKKKKKLINIVIEANALLILLQKTITYNYQRFWTIIDLVFIINNITNRLIKYNINKEIENLSNYLSI